MWTVIYIAPNLKKAEQIQDKLTAEGFMIKIRQVKISREQHEILVPESEVGEIQEVLGPILHS